LDFSVPMGTLKKTAWFSNKTTKLYVKIHYESAEVCHIA